MQAWYKRLISRFSKRDIIVGLILGLVFLTGPPWWFSEIRQLLTQSSSTRSIREEVAFLPGDFEINLRAPYAEGSRDSISVRVAVEAVGANVQLLRTATVVKRSIESEPFDYISFQESEPTLIRVRPRHALVGTIRPKTYITLDFDASALIPHSTTTVDASEGMRDKFGELTVRLFYKRGDEKLSTNVNIPMYFVKK